MMMMEANFFTRCLLLSGKYMGEVKYTIRYFQFLISHQILMCLLVLFTILISYKEFYTYQNQQGGGSEE